MVGSVTFGRLMGRRPNQGYRQPGGKDNPKSGNPLCCRILPDIAGDCRILPDIAGDCRKLHAGPRGLDIAGYCRILPDFARILPDIAGYCRTKRLAKFGNVRQRSAIFGNIGFAGYCQILPADCRKLLTTPALWFLCARYLARGEEARHYGRMERTDNFQFQSQF